MAKVKTLQEMFRDYYDQILTAEISDRKTTKGQFARDDPAFLVMLAITFVILTLSFGILTSLPVKDMLFVMFWLVGIDCIGCGMLVATFFWFIGNKFLLSHPRSRGMFSFESPIAVPVVLLTSQ